MASNHSGTTTNPNTPRAEHEREESPVADTANPNISERHEDEAASVSEANRAGSTSPSTDASRRRLYDIQPTWPRKVDQTKIRARVCWQPASSLEQVFLDIHWNPRGNAGSAFFKLHTNLRLEGVQSSRRDGRVSVYVFIYPERIRELFLDADPQLSPFGTNTIALNFSMKMPSAILLPKAYAGVSLEAEEAMGSLVKLSKQMSFTVYASLPRRKIPVAWMQQLCDAVTGQRLSTIASCANVVNFYQGCGGQLLEGNSLSQPVAGASCDSAQAEPPAYDHDGPVPRSANSSQCSVLLLSEIRARMLIDVQQTTRNVAAAAPRLRTRLLTNWSTAQP